MHIGTLCEREDPREKMKQRERKKKRERERVNESV